MSRRVGSVAVLGGGSAGLLSALTFRRMLPHVKVTLIHSPSILVIGVGESTTRAMPPFLHDLLRLDRGEFYREVQPSWKLGIRFEWGRPGDHHFNYSFAPTLEVKVQQLPRINSFYCLEEMTDASLFVALMDRGLSPCLHANGHYRVNEAGGYHIENKAFVAFLKRKAEKLGVESVDAEVTGVPLNESGEVAALRLDDDRSITADLYVDASGFQSLLLGKTLGAPYVPYDKTLFCDRAVVGGWSREGPVQPYTTVETMDRGWCWKIEFLDHVTRGYVFSSAFASNDQAMAELRRKNPQLTDDLRVISFPSGRYEDFWVKNVAAIGNASGFVEPLEATALQHACEQVRFLCRALRDANGIVSPPMQKIENRRFRLLWDDLRNFLSIHYRFNRRCDTPFWRHCREQVDLGDAAEFVEYFQRVGPSILSKSLLPDVSIFGYEGYLTLLLGQGVPTDFRFEWSDEERRTWQQYQGQIASAARSALPVREALERVFGDWTWPTRGD